MALPRADLLLTWRDIKVRYKQATLGIAWAILQPMLTTAITSLVFGYLLKVDTGSLPYPVFTLAALLPWHLFQLSLQKSSISLVGNANLITKFTSHASSSRSRRCWRCWSISRSL